MKKVSKKRQKYFIKYAKKKALYEQKRKLKRKKLRALSNKQQVVRKKTRKFLDEPKKVDHTFLKAGETFSLNINTEEVIEYFSKARNSLKKGKPVIFDLEDVIKMGPETLTYLCAFVNDPRIVKGVPIKGNTPKDPKLKKMFRDARFYDFVISPKSRGRYAKDVFTSLIHKVTRKKVENKIAAKVCKAAYAHTFESTEKIDNKVYQKFYLIKYHKLYFR